MLVKRLFAYLMCAYLKSERCFNVNFSAYHFHMKAKILADFQIYISIPLRIIYSKPYILILLTVQNISVW